MTVTNVAISKLGISQQKKKRKWPEKKNSNKQPGQAIEINENDQRWNADIILLAFLVSSLNT